MRKPRVLIISNNALSLSDSNGRTLQSFLLGWPSDRLAQFYIQNSRPDFTVCQNFFQVTDRQALQAFLGRGPAGGPVSRIPLRSAKIADKNHHRPARTPLTMLARELVWNSYRWMGRAFQSWVADFKPEVVLLQAGDCGFMFRLAQNVARQYHAPLVIYNSEAYYFKENDYFRSKGLEHWCYPLFHRRFCRQFRETVSAAAYSIYICQALQADYDREFGLPSETIYTATTVQKADTQKQGTGFTVSYLGNLGVGRHVPLTEIANALQEISPQLYLDIYGKIPNQEVRTALNACQGIRYRGFVDYERVQEIMRNSDLLIHSENFSGFYRADLKYAFSTKIADSLASGTCFLLYAPPEMACTRYLRENEAAWVVCDQKKLKETLRVLVESPQERQRYLGQAAVLVEQNHRAEKNAERFQTVLCRAAENNGAPAS